MLFVKASYNRAILSHLSASILFRQPFHHSLVTAMTPTTTITKSSSKTAQGRKSISQPLTPLQQRWTTLYTTTLPKLASSESTVQGNGKWPVTIDHCFARIILDNAVGVDKPWTQAVRAPATKNMTPVQLKACVTLAEKVVNGEVDLWELDDKSLRFRGKQSKDRLTSGKKTNAMPESKKKRKMPDSETPAGTKKSRKQEAAENWSDFSFLQAPDSVPSLEEDAEILPDIRHIIDSSAELTTFRRDCLNLLIQVPRGRYTTYQAISDAMSKTHPNVTKSGGKETSRASGCARAVGMAMRTNPFAPTVPCHRVLASDGKIGGFKGDWGKEGKFYNEKMRLLTEEGVRFDANGKVIGEPFRGFS